MKRIIGTSVGMAAVALAFVAIQAQGQSVYYNFSDATPDGWTLGGFSAGAAPTLSNIGGQNYLYLPLGGFQVANVGSGYAGNLSTFTATMAAALNNPAGYDISYNYYIDTSKFSGSTFLQFGTFLNAGSGYYSQDYGSPNQVSLSGAQIATGQVFQGSVTINLAAVFANDANAATENFFRLGLIVNGNGTGLGVNVTDISVAPAPEPSTFALIGLGACATMLMFRRRLA